MEERPLTLYIVSPDANAATLKRLRGLGTSTGLTVTAMTQISDLPATPSNSSILLLPSDLVANKDKLEAWKNLFIICSAKTDNPTTSGNIIRINTTAESPADWIRITNTLIKYILKAEGKSSWHALRHKISSREFNIAAELTRWIKSNKALNTEKLSQITNILGTVESMHGGQKSCPTTLSLSLEASHLHLDIQTINTTNLDVKQLSSFFSSLDFCEAATIEANDKLQIYAVFSLEAKVTQRIVFEVSKPMATQDVTKEAS